MPLGAVENTRFGKIFKYKNVVSEKLASKYYNVCYKFNNRDYFLDFMQRSANNLMHDQRAYEKALNEKKVTKADFDDFIFQSEMILDSLYSVYMRFKRESKGYRGYVVVCFADTKRILAHEKMHALIGRSTGLMASKFFKSPSKRRIYETTAFMLVSGLGPKSYDFAKYALTGIIERHQEELVTGLVSIAYVLARQKKLGEKEAKKAILEASNAFFSYFTFPESEFQKFTDMAIQSAYELNDKYKGNLENIASDYGKIYRDGLRVHGIVR